MDFIKATAALGCISLALYFVTGVDIALYGAIFISGFLTMMIMLYIRGKKNER